MGSKDKPGHFDCFANAAPDEPMFVLLARDKHAPQLVEMWAGMRAAAGEDPAKVEEALKCAKAMRKYRYERKGAPSCEMCGSDSRCTKIATKIVTEDDTLWQFWCASEEMQFLVDDGCERTIQTIGEYFATDEVENEYCNDEALRVFHETRAMRARANEAVMGDDSEEELPDYGGGMSGG